MLTSSFAGLAIDPELWRDCANTPFDTTNLTGDRHSWQSSDLLLYQDRPKRASNVARFKLSTEESTTLVENGGVPDSGL